MSNVEKWEACVRAAGRLADLVCAMYHPGDVKARKTWPTATWAEIIAAELGVPYGLVDCPHCKEETEATQRECTRCGLPWAGLPCEGIKIEGRRWFQRTYGNTYHSVRIWRQGTAGKPGEELVYLPYQYGYGDQYLQTALEWLKANKLAPPSSRFGTQYMREELGLTWTVVDVQRQREL